MKKLVYVVRQETLTDLTSGFGQRVRLLLEVLPRGLGEDWTCELLSPFPHAEAPSGWKPVFGGPQMVPNTLYQLWRRRLAPLWQLKEARDPLGWAEFTASLLGIDILQIDALRNGLEKSRADVVLLSRCDLLPVLSPGLKADVVVDTNDLLSNLLRVYRPRARLLKWLGVSTEELIARSAAFERSMYQRCTPVAIAREDADWLAAAGCLRTILEAQCVSPRTQPNPKNGETAGTVRVGYFGGSHAGSIASAGLFCQVAGQVKGDPTLKFEVAGKVCEQLNECILPDNVILRGRVESMELFLSEMDVVLLLSAGETGTSVKFQEALFSGTPVIANREAARFAGALSGLDYTLVQSAQDAVASLRGRTWVRPDTNGRAEKFGRCAVAARWRNIIETASK